jgi:hypothetical protein
MKICKKRANRNEVVLIKSVNTTVEETGVGGTGMGGTGRKQGARYDGSTSKEKYAKVAEEHVGELQAT